MWWAPPSGRDDDGVRAWAEFTGQSAADVADEGWTAAIHPADRSRVSALWYRAAKAREPFEATYRVRRHDGVYRMMHLRVVPVLDERGEIADWVGLATDETEERFRGYFEQSLVGVMVARPDRGLVEVNQAACDLLGYSREELLGLTWTELTHPDDLAADVARNQRILAGEVDGARFEKRLIRKDGAVVDADMSLSCQRGADGSVDHFLALVSDVTERRRLGDELDDERLRFKQLVENSGEAILLTQPDGAILSANPEACRMLGRSEEEICALGRAGIVDPTDPRLASGLEEREQTGRATRELRFVRGDGTTFPVQVTSRVYSDHEGMLRTSTVILDLTDRERAEAANARLAAIVESSDDAILSEDLDGSILTWNRGAERLYGYAAGEVVGKSISVLAPPGSEDQLMTLFPLIRRGESVRHTETVRVRKDGSSIDVLIGISPIRDAAGVVVGVSTITHDITARKRAERLMGATSEILEIIASPRPVRETAQGIVDALKRATGLDAVGLRLQQGEDFPFVAAAGYTEEFLRAENDLVARYPDGGVCRSDDGSVCLECTCGLVVTGAIDPASDLFTPGGSCWTNDSLPSRATPATEDLRLNPRDRCVHDGFLSVALIPLRAGEQILGLVHLADYRRDRFAPESIRFFEGLGASIGVALSRKQAESEIRSLNAELEARVSSRTAQLEATNKELEAFAYSVSHDLRAPLRAIDGFSAMVIEDGADKLDETDVEHLQRVRDAAQRMAALIDDLLGLSRVGRQDMQLAPVNVSALAEEVLAELRSAEPGRSVECVVAPGLHAKADAVLLRMILANLLGNAWKFTGKHDTARIEVGETDGEERAFFIRDDGAGFDARYAENLFGAFQRMHSPQEFEGVGIGLATVQRLVARHGGRVWAEAEVEKGATFYFTLPAPAATG